MSLQKTRKQQLTSGHHSGELPLESEEWLPWWNSGGKAFPEGSRVTYRERIESREWRTDPGRQTRNDGRSGRRDS